ncbi:hypothetical protein KPG71_18895 [Roseovarius sp. PS-C2]|nr:hypothetical protein [Roseovarius sp. PS-C2]
MFDGAVLFRRIRNWVPSGIGMMSTHSVFYQMGGRPSVDPYGWSQARIQKALDQLMDEGSITASIDLCGKHFYVTDAGIEKYEGELAS